MLSILYTIAGIALIVYGIYLIFSSVKKSNSHTKPEVPVGTFRIVKDNDRGYYLLEVYRETIINHQPAIYAWDWFDQYTYVTYGDAMDRVVKYRHRCCSWKKVLHDPNLPLPKYTTVWIEA